MKMVSSLWVCVILAVLFAGCAIFKTNSGQQVINDSEVLFSNALSTAVSVLTSEGSQQLAIAAAQSYIASNVENAQAQQVCNQIIETSVPIIAADIQNMTVKGVSVKDRAAARRDTYIASDKYKAIVKKCSKEFAAKYK